MLRKDLLAALFVAFLAWFPSVTQAQLGAPPPPSAPSEEEARIVPQALQEPMVWVPGAPADAWLATGLTIGGAVLVFTSAAIVSEFGRRDERLSLDPATTQLRAAQLHQSATDLILATNVLLVIGTAAAVCSIAWSIVLPFGSHQVPAPRVRAGLLSLSIEGSF